MQKPTRAHQTESASQRYRASEKYRFFRLNLETNGMREKCHAFINDNEDKLVSVKDHASNLCGIYCTEETHSELVNSLHPAEIVIEIQEIPNTDTVRDDSARDRTRPHTPR